MKTKINLATYATIIICCMFAQIANAQWQNYGSAFGNSYNEPDNTSGLNIESVGIGQFNAMGAPPYPLSAFHINTNLLNYYTLFS